MLDVGTVREVRDDHPIEMLWSVDLAPDVSFVKLCALLDEGRPFRTYARDSRNIAQNAERDSASTRCVLRLPLPGWPIRKESNLEIAVAVCNAADQ